MYVCVRACVCWSFHPFSIWYILYNRNIYLSIYPSLIVPDGCCQPVIECLGTVSFVSCVCLSDGWCLIGYLATAANDSFARFSNFSFAHHLLTLDISTAREEKAKGVVDRSSTVIAKEPEGTQFVSFSIARTPPITPHQFLLTKLFSSSFFDHFYYPLFISERLSPRSTPTHTHLSRHTHTQTHTFTHTPRHWISIDRESIRWADLNQTIQENQFFSNIFIEIRRLLWQGLEDIYDVA